MHVGSAGDERQRDATPVDQKAALAALFFPRSVGFGPTPCWPSGALLMAPSTLCHFQAMPSIPSYSARPDLQIRRKKPSRCQRWKWACTALALPYSLGSAFHWHPVRRTYTIAENICRAGIGLRPAPGFRWYWPSNARFRSGTSGSTLRHNSSETVQDLICAILKLIFARLHTPSNTESQ